MKLVVVESPAKAKTIEKFLGKEYVVLPSYGHVRDLPASVKEIPPEIKSKPWAAFAVDVTNQYRPYYIIPKDSKKTIDALKKRLSQAQELILATDEDREGESISWHLREILQPKIPVKRIVFHEITRKAILEALQSPRDINEQLVRAQESRRILDRLFGYSLSPVLWKKVRANLSAGRVQSVALRLVVEREEERRAFRKAEYWDIVAELRTGDLTFEATLVTLDGTRLAEGKDFDPTSGTLKQDSAAYWLRQEEAEHLCAVLKQGLPWRIASVEQKETTQKPQPPFITSTLQQAASSAFGFTPKKTMRIAQELYEGVELAHGEREGLITYMRTDSVTLSEEALTEAAKVIQQQFGSEYYGGPRRYVTKSKMAQEAHEAIRPTVLSRTPESVRAYLTEDQYRLYELIWRRTLASQMRDAVLLRTTVTIEARSEGRTALFRATGSVVKFPGFLRVLNNDSERERRLPQLREGQLIVSADAEAAGTVRLDTLRAVSHETQPPARYTEASLIRALEEEGIGRPSTYAPTLSVIQERGYVTKKGSALVPTYLGIAVIHLLRDYFPEFIDVKFTAQMEDALDAIAEGEREWTEFLETFYRGKPSGPTGLEKAIRERSPKIPYPAIPVGEDPVTGEPIVVRFGMNGRPYLQRGAGGAGNTAPIPEDVFYESLTPERAHELLESRKNAEENVVAVDPATQKPVYLMEGPYGFYLQVGKGAEGEETSKTRGKAAKPRRVSLPKDVAPEAVTADLAVKLLSLPREVGKHPTTGSPIIADIGRYGPYLRCDSETRSLSDWREALDISLEEAVQRLATPKTSRRATPIVLRTLGQDAAGRTIELREGRYGRYVTDGEVNATLPKDADPDRLTLEEACAWLEAKHAAPSAKKPRRKKSTS